MKGMFNDAINSSVNFIESRLTENLSINELAEQAFFSKTHYQRLFHSIVGEPVMEYIKKRRLQLACLELCETNASVIEIALKHGYGSHEGFSRAFKACFGVAPTQYRKLNAGRHGGKYHRKEDAEMLSNEVLDRITVNTETIAKVLEQFKNDAEKLSALANRTAAAEGTNGTAILILSGELLHLAERTGKVKKSVQSFADSKQSVFEISEKIYTLMKNLDDITFQMNLLRFFSGIETRKIDGAREKFIAIDGGFADLCGSLAGNKNSMVNLINELISLIRTDIKTEAIDRIKGAVDLLSQTANEGNEISGLAKEASGKLGGNGGAFYRIAGEVGKRTAKVITVAEMLDCCARDMEKSDLRESPALDIEPIAAAINSIENIAFYMNINAFNSSIEAAQNGDNNALTVCTDRIMQYAGCLHQAYASCAELFGECVKLIALLRNGKKETSVSLFKKCMEDILVQGEILSIQLGLESERIKHEAFKTLARNAEEARTALSGSDTLNYREELLKYYEATLKLAKDCHAEAAALKNADAFEYIASEYDKFSERVKRVSDNIFS